MDRKNGMRPVHPGEIIKQDILPSVGLSVTAAAKALGVSRQMLHDILAERRPLSALMCFKVSRLFGGSPDLWMRMQAAYDLNRQQGLKNRIHGLGIPEYARDVGIQQNRHRSNAHVCGKTVQFRLSVVEPVFRLEFAGAIRSTSPGHPEPQVLILFVRLVVVTIRRARVPSIVVERTAPPHVKTAFRVLWYQPRQSLDRHKSSQSA